MIGLLQIYQRPNDLFVICDAHPVNHCESEVIYTLFSCAKGVVNNYGGGRLKCSVMVKMFVDPSNL